MEKFILKKLTSIDLTTKFPKPKEINVLNIDGIKINVFYDDVLVVGSGAAGFRACVELLNKKISVSAITSILYGGTSACSGSDKQTIFSCSTSLNGDNVKSVADAISAGGSMDYDKAYIEAVNSYLALEGLRVYGLDIPTDKYGTILRYKTDHDDSGRATSCGPRTSRLMVKVLAKKASEQGLKLLDSSCAIDIIKNKENSAIGVVAISKEFINKNNKYGLFIFKAKNIVLAGGGAGDLYRDSVYPYKCTGNVGMALVAGISVCNIQEQQFGIGTPRNKFPWNLSGTYMQAIPDVYSIDNCGKKYHFLDDYYSNTKELCSNIFRKGYQWPIHAMRTLNYGSSLFDLAVYLEIKKGRKVYLDFRRNYQSNNPDDLFDIEKLDRDVKKYLQGSASLQETPYARLKNMNELAIELYRMHGYDLEKEPLEFTINHQHFNGGISIDINGKTSIDNIFAIGECAGSHGVTRPGGSALNSGQVFAIRVANYIDLRLKENNKYVSQNDELPYIRDCIKNIKNFISLCNSQESLDFSEVRNIIQALLSDHCGFLCNRKDVRYVNNVLEQLHQGIESKGFKNFKSYEDILTWRSLIYEARAIASSLDFYIENGGGSRGARIIFSDESCLVPKAKSADLSNFKLLEERLEDRKWIITSKFKGTKIVTSQRAAVKELKLENSSFEAQWNKFLLGKYKRVD